MVNINATTPQLKVVKEWLTAYTDRDVEKVASFLSKNYKYESYPKSASVADQTKEEHINKFAKISTSLTKSEIIIHEVIEAPGKVVTHSTSNATTADGQEVSGDAFSIITLVEEDGGLKILSWKSFNDAEKYAAFSKV